MRTIKRNSPFFGSALLPRDNTGKEFPFEFLNTKRSIANNKLSRVERIDRVCGVETDSLYCFMQYFDRNIFKIFSFVLQPKALCHLWYCHAFFDVTHNLGRFNTVHRSEERRVGKV